MQKRRYTRPFAAPGEGRFGPRRAPTPLALRIMGTDKEVPLPEVGQKLCIGSDPSNDIVVEDVHVSGFHCFLERRGTHELVLHDRKSTNGTFVNGVRVGTSQVDAGARITVGGVSLALVTRRIGLPAAEALVGHAPAFRAAVDQVMRAAKSGSPVLLHGESGTGKELFARLVHQASRRADGPYVAVNCAAIAPSLVEAELFGHEKGAFTGATERRAGFFEQADGGTLFLDELGELPWPQQSRLLRVLETRRIRRVGGHGEREIDVRVVSATHTDLGAAVAQRRFRLDLFHRLATIQVRIPPLRERAGDIPLLCRSFLEELVPEVGRRTIEPGAMQALMRCRWPGNVRELRNCVYRAASMGEGPLTAEQLLPQGPPRSAASVPAAVRRLIDEAARDDERPPTPLTMDALRAAEELGMEDMVKRAMARALARCGTQRRAAQYLGMARSTFHERAHRYGLAAPKPTSDELRDAARDDERDETSAGDSDAPSLRAR
jgi:DNA-binding NtrC family response regulator